MSRINVATWKLMENFLLEAFYTVVPVELKSFQSKNYPKHDSNIRSFILGVT